MNVFANWREELQHKLDRSDLPLDDFSMMPTALRQLRFTSWKSCFMRNQRYRVFRLPLCLRPLGISSLPRESFYQRWKTSTRKHLTNMRMKKKILLMQIVLLYGDHHGIQQKLTRIVWQLLTAQWNLWKEESLVEAIRSSVLGLHSLNEWIIQSSCGKRITVLVKPNLPMWKQRSEILMIIRLNILEWLISS